MSASRILDDCPKRPQLRTYHPSIEKRTHEIEVITPLFGGGLEAGVNDPITLIGPSSNRGQQPSLASGHTPRTQRRRWAHC